MKAKLLKIVGILFGSFIVVVLVVFVIYVILHYPRKADPFEINTTNPTRDVLIATQGSDFKDALVNTLCDSLKQSSAHIKGIDVGSLADVSDEDWDRILIITTFMVRLNRDVDRFVDSASTPEKILLLVTSGGADWQPQPELMVDAITSASRKVYIEGLVHLIAGWLTREDDHGWHPDDYVLALRYFPRVDVKAACEAITLERERYRALYPNLVDLINQVGYLYLRMEDVTSALEVFRLNVSLFPDHWNVYDSYGEVLLMKGDRESAIRNYRKALELNPDSKSAKDKLTQLEKR